MKNTIQDASMAREINRSEIITEAKNRQNRYEETKNNFFNTMTSTFQAYQGYMNKGPQQTPGQPSNPYGATPPQNYGYPQAPPQGSNFGGYGAPPGYPQYPQAPYGQQGQGYPQPQYSQFGQPPAPGGYGYPQQPGMPGMPQFPQGGPQGFPGQNRPPNYPRGY